MTISVVFENRGEIDVRAITTLGVSVKSDSAIGYFGTGLKFSISTILRNGGSIEIYSGEALYTFTSEIDNVQGKDFNIIHMNNKPLGFTTEMGRDWEPWMAVREILCNCKDEGGSYGESLDIVPEEGKTIVVVKCDKFLNSFRERGTFIIDKDRKPFLTLDGLQVFKGGSTNLFYKGVKVYTAPKPYIYTYNLLRSTQLTEDRQLKYESFDNHYTLAELIMKIDNNEFINALCSCGDAFYEHSLQYSQGSPSEPLMARVRRSEGTIDRKVPPYLSSKCKPSISEQLKVKRDSEMNRVQEGQLEKAKNFLKDLDLYCDKYTIRVMDSLGEGVLGLADTDTQTIYLSKGVFGLGTKYVAGTLYEEYIHIEYGVLDETRGFQDLVINQLMSLGEVLKGEAI